MDKLRGVDVGLVVGGVVAALCFVLAIGAAIGTGRWVIVGVLLGPPLWVAWDFHGNAFIGESIDVFMRRRAESGALFGAAYLLGAGAVTAGIVFGVAIPLAIEAVESKRRTDGAAEGLPKAETVPMRGAPPGGGPESDGWVRTRRARRERLGGVKGFSGGTKEAARKPRVSDWNDESARFARVLGFYNEMLSRKDWGRVRSQFRRLAKHLHPDGDVTVEPGERKVREEKLKAISEAFAFFRQRWGGVDEEERSGNKEGSN